MTPLPSSASTERIYHPYSTFSILDSIARQKMSEKSLSTIDTIENNRLEAKRSIVEIETLLAQKIHSYSVMLRNRENLAVINGKLGSLHRKLQHFETTYPFFQGNHSLVETLYTLSAKGTEAKLQIDKLCSPEVYHINCSQIRAQGLLAHRQDGTYMLWGGNYLPGNRISPFYLSWIALKQLHTKAIDLYSNGECALQEGNQRLNLDQLVKLVINSPQLFPLADAPSNHTLAQLEWSVAEASADQIKQHAKRGDFFLTKEGDGSFLLHIVQRKPHPCRTLPLRVSNGRIICDAEGQKIKAPDLYHLACKQLGPGSYLHIITAPREASMTEELLYRMILPTMQRERITWAALPRYIFRCLRHSLWVHCNKSGMQVYRQDHRKSFCTNDGVLITADKKQILGKGSYKRVYPLVSACAASALQPMVRAKFKAPLANIKSHIDTINQLRRELEGDRASQFLLLPHYVTYINSKGRQVAVQIMPFMERDLLEALKSAFPLSLTAICKIMRDIGYGLLGMHAKGYVHQDIKPENIMLDGDNNAPIARLCDFDFTQKYSETSALSRCHSPLFADPAFLQGIAHGLEGGKLHDQFSFGATLYAGLTNSTLRGEVTTCEEVESWVTENDLSASPQFANLAAPLQEIIRKCCVGPADERTYQLEEFVKMLASQAENPVSCN
jgi:hypothetical protein